MKAFSLLAAVALLSACTTAPVATTSTSTTTTRSAMHPDERRTIAKRSYTQEDLQKTGHPTLGGALQTVDPSVYISGGR